MAPAKSGSASGSSTSTVKGRNFVWIFTCVGQFCKLREKCLRADLSESRSARLGSLSVPSARAVFYDVCMRQAPCTHCSFKW